MCTLSPIFLSQNHRISRVGRDPQGAWGQTYPQIDTGKLLLFLPTSDWSEKFRQPPKRDRAAAIPAYAFIMQTSLSWASKSGRQGSGKFPNTFSRSLYGNTGNPSGKPKSWKGANSEHRASEHASIYIQH